MFQPIVSLAQRFNAIPPPLRASLLIIFSTLAHMICLPSAGLAVVSLLDLNEFVMAGVLLIAACPSGSIANLYVFLARANVALTVALRRWRSDPRLPGVGPSARSPRPFPDP